MISLTDVKKQFIRVGLIFLVVLLSSCNGGGSNGGNSSNFNIAASIKGLNIGQSFTINLGTNSIIKQINANGQITLEQTISRGTDYNVTIPVQPQNEKCSVTGGQGQIIDSNVVVQVTCSDNTYSLGGTVSGLEPGESLTLQDYDQVTNQITLTNNTSLIYQNKNFTFNENVPYLGSYNVQVLKQPQNQTCKVNNPMGVVSKNISNINVTCSKSSYPVSVKYIGNKPINQNIVLVNNSNPLDKVSVNATNQNGQFKNRVPYGESYHVTILNNPSNYTCNFINQNSGTPVDANSSPTVELTCFRNNTYFISGNVTGLAPGQGVTISASVPDTNPFDLLTSDGSFTYPHTFKLGDSYNFTINNQPQNQYCTLSNGSGIISGNVTNLAVNCSYENGELVPLNPSKIISGSGNMFSYPSGIAITNNHKYAYVANSNDDSISMYQVTSNGILVSLSSASIPTIKAPSSVIIGPNDQYVYVLSYLHDLMAIYSINNDGTLSNIASNISIGNQPWQLSFTSDNKYAYIVNYEGNNISMFSVKSDGTLQSMSPSSIATGQSPVSMTITSDNAYAYVVNQIGQTVSMYTIGVNGELQAMSPNTVGTGKWPSGIVVTTNNKFVYVVNQNGNNVYTYQVGLMGGLGAPTITSIDPTESPISVSLSPDNKYLYVLTYSSTYGYEGVSIFSINNLNGSLTPLQFVPIETFGFLEVASTSYNQLMTTISLQNGINYAYVISNNEVYMYSIYNSN